MIHEITMPPGVRPPDEDGFHVREASVNPPNSETLVLRVKGAAHHYIMTWGGN